MAWQLLAAALPAAAKTVGTYLNKPDQDDYKPQTDYMKKYLSYLRGRQANKEVMHMAMQPQLRAVGQQGRQMQRQVGYDVAKTGLTGSGIEAQMRLSAGQKTQQALSTATEKAVAAQTAETARLGEKAADVEARIGAEEQRSEQAFKTAKSQWKKQLAGDIIGLGASVASAGIQQGVANKGAYQQAVTSGTFEGSYDDFKTAAETGELPSLTGEGVDTVGRVSPSEYVQLRGARQQVIDQIEFSETVLGENVVQDYLGKGWSRQQIYKEASDQRDFERIVKNKIGADATLEEINVAVPQVIAAGGAGTGTVPAGAGGGVTPATDVSDALQTIGGVPPAGEVIPEVKPGVVPGVNEDMKIEVDEGGKKVVPFDPESSKYNEHYGDLIGLKPATEAEHRGSVAEDLSHLPENIQAQVKKELGDDVLLVLKGRKHETWDLAVEGEKKEGRKIVKGAGGYYYSVPDKKVKTVTPVKKTVKPVTTDKTETTTAFIDIQKAYPDVSQITTAAGVGTTTAGEEYINIAYGGREVKLFPGSRKEVSKKTGYHYALVGEDGKPNWVSETDPELQTYLSKYVKPSKTVATTVKSDPLNVKTVSKTKPVLSDFTKVKGRFKNPEYALGEIDRSMKEIIKLEDESRYSKTAGGKQSYKNSLASASELREKLKNKIKSIYNPKTGKFRSEEYKKLFEEGTGAIGEKTGFADISAAVNVLGKEVPFFERIRKVDLTKVQSFMKELFSEDKILASAK